MSVKKETTMGCYLIKFVYLLFYFTLFAHSFRNLYYIHTHTTMEKGKIISSIHIFLRWLKVLLVALFV